MNSIEFSDYYMESFEDISHHLDGIVLLKVSIDQGCSLESKVDKSLSEEQDKFALELASMLEKEIQDKYEECCTISAMYLPIKFKISN